jgi:hypothetical protein
VLVVFATNQLFLTSPALGQTLVKLSGSIQPRIDQVEIAPAGGYTMRGFLLKTMQNVNCLPEAHGIDRSIGITIEILDEFQNACSMIAAKGLCARGHSAKLCDIERVTQGILNGLWEFPQIFAARANPEYRFHSLTCREKPDRNYAMPILAYNVKQSSHLTPEVS